MMLPLSLRSYNPEDQMGDRRSDHHPFPFSQLVYQSWMHYTWLIQIIVVSRALATQVVMHPAFTYFDLNNISNFK